MFPWQGGTADPKETTREWKRQLKSQQRALDKQIRGIQREEDKVKRSIKAAAKRGDVGNAKTLAKEIVRSRKAVNRLHTSKAQMNSVMMQMENQMGARYQGEKPVQNPDARLLLIIAASSPTQRNKRSRAT